MCLTAYMPVHHEKSSASPARVGGYLLFGCLLFLSLPLICRAAHKRVVGLAFSETPAAVVQYFVPCGDSYMRSILFGRRAVNQAADFMRDQNRPGNAACHGDTSIS